MVSLYTDFIKNKRQKNLMSEVEVIAEEVKLHSKEADEHADFPLEILNVLKSSGYTSYTLPEHYGGKGLSLYEFVMLQERLAIGDGSTALSIGWHLGTLMELSDQPIWDQNIYEWLTNEVTTHKRVINRAASERATGSPTRGGIPETKALKNGTKYNINGRKTFTTMASVLDYFIVSAFVEDLNEVGWFIIHKSNAGVKIDKTWDTLGMRGTGSHDLVLEDVQVDESSLVELVSSKKNTPKGWLLHIPACYLGIAIAARNDAIQFAKSFKPNSLNTTISEVPHIQHKIGEMDIKLMNARHFMYSVAEKWDDNPTKRSDLNNALASVKYVATNTANEVVDLAMRIAGGRGLSRDNTFEKYYRDVRAGLHNPPMDDSVIQMLAKHALENED